MCISVSVFNPPPPPPQRRPMAFPRVSRQPLLHFLSVGRQTNPESEKNHSLIHSERGREGVRAKEREAEVRIGLHSPTPPQLGSPSVHRQSLSWATVWITFHPQLFSSTCPVLACLCCVFQDMNREKEQKNGVRDGETKIVD